MRGRYPFKANKDDSTAHRSYHYVKRCRAGFTLLFLFRLFLELSSKLEFAILSAHAGDVDWQRKDSRRQSSCNSRVNALRQVLLGTAERTFLPRQEKII
ncbi:hypothetical protein L596_021346 [Steinernema carpocapsae]|uniref:Uncharacterized protein n=1 Tax=Steinernema carpocapsae TaxID=34508 RepID=A0A4U5MIG6_STECR|nr:hypothetical protein L596_021346 [Steinernema carpocapsae]